MNKVSRDTLKKSTKHLMVISTIATLLMATLSITTTTNASAFNFGLLSNDDNTGSIDTDSLFSCVGAAINCVNENEENNNIIANNDAIPPPPPEEPGTLTVTKQILCFSNGGIPNDDAVCSYAVTSDNFPQQGDFTITVTGNDPDPSSFPGSSTGTPVVIGAGDYSITEEFPNTDALQDELIATSIEFLVGVEGDCTLTDPDVPTITGTMTSGDSQTCLLVNTVIINGGVVPI